MSHQRQLQKTIPQVLQEEIEVQTDINLVGRSFEASQINEGRHQLRLADFCTEHGLLQPFSDYYLYAQLQDIIVRMKKDAQNEGDSEKQQKLLQFLSVQIDGLLKRELMLGGQKSSYYSLLSEKDQEILKMQIKYSSYDSQLKKANETINNLYHEIGRLRSSLQQLQCASESNTVFAQCFTSLSKMLNQNATTQNITTLISPIVKETEQKLESIIKSSTKIRQSKVQGLISEYAKQLNKFYYDENLNLQSLSQSVAAFYSNLQHLRGDNWIEQRMNISVKYDNLKNHQLSLMALLRQNIQAILNENPSLKTLREFQQFVKILEEEERNGVETMVVNGWVSVGKTDQRIVEVPVQDARTKEIIALLSTQLSKITSKYPQIKEELSRNIEQLISLNVLEESIEVEALDRLKEIVVYRSDLLKVQNVYNYSNQKDKQLICTLRILIKSLLEELQKMKSTYGATIDLDEGILKLINQQILEITDVSAILGLFRPQPKIVEVQRIVEKPIYILDQLQQSIPVNIERPTYGERIIEQPVVVQKSVPLQIEKPIQDIVKEYVEVKTTIEVPVQVPTVVEKPVQKLLIDEKILEVNSQKLVPYREQVRQVITSEIEKIVRHPEVVEKEIPVELIQEVIKEVQTYVQKPVYLFKESERVVQIPVLKEIVQQKPIYLEVEKKVPYVVRTPQIHQLIKEVPQLIMESTEIIKPVPEILEKIVTVSVEKDPQIIEVPVTVEKELIREVEKEIAVEMTHFVKGDREQIIKQVQVFVDKPIIQEVILEKNKQIQKITPLYIREEKPVYVDIKVPYIKPEIRPIDLVVEKPIFLKEEVVKEVKVEVPIPIVIEKEIVKVQECIKEKLVEKIVEVPRVEIVQKIVQKVVVVPRIIQKIVEVPKIIEKCVVIDKPMLEIVQIPKEITVEKVIQIPKIVQLSHQVLVDNPTFQEVQIQVPVEITIEKETPVQIQVERRIPHEVIKEVAVQMFRDKVVQKIVQINEVKVKDRQVQIPVIVDKPVPLIQEKAVLHIQKVENVMKIPQTIEKIVSAEKIIDRPVEIKVIEEVLVEKDVEVEIPGETVVLKEKQIQNVEVIKEKIVEKKVTEEIAKEVYLQVEKIVPLNVEKIVRIPEIQYISKPELIEISHPVHHINYKEVPVQIQNTRHIPVRTILEEIKEIQVQVEKSVSVTVEKQKIIKCIENVREWCEREVVKEVYSDVVVRESPITEIKQIYVQKLIEPLKNRIIQIQEEEKTIEKVVQKIVMLPQIVEVVKTIHEISQVQSVGVASGVQKQIHTSQYVGLTEDLKGQMSSLLTSFKSKVRSQPDLKILIEAMQKYLLVLDKWIKFPKIIQIPKEVEMVVEKDRPVLVPIKETQKQMALMSIIEKLIMGLRKFRKNQIKQNLDEDLLNIFFLDLDIELSETSFKNRYNEYLHDMKEKYKTFGSWADNYAVLLNTFLQTRFSMTNLIGEANRANQENQYKIRALEEELDHLKVISMINEFAKEKVAGDYGSLVKSLVALERDELVTSIIEKHTSILSPERYFNEMREREEMSERKGENRERLITEKERQIQQIIVKVSTLEEERSKRQQIATELLRENQSLRTQLKIMSEQAEGGNIQESLNKINEEWEKRIINMKQKYEKEIDRLREQVKNQLAEGLSSTELMNENRRLSESFKQMKKEYETLKKDQENANRQSEGQRKKLIEEYERKINSIQEKNEREKKRQVEGARRSFDTSQQSSEIAKQRLIDDYERKIKNLTENHQRQLQRVKSASSIRGGEHSSSPQVEVRKYQEQIKRLQLEISTLKKENQSYHKSRLTRTGYTSGYKQSIVEEYDYERVERESEGRMRDSRISKESRQSQKQELSQIRSSSSKVSGKSFSIKSSMKLKDLMECSFDNRKSVVTAIMIKILQKYEESKREIMFCYSPANIQLTNFDLSNLDAMTVSFLSPITDKNHKYDRLFLAPEVHKNKGIVITMKAIVFSLGVIWDLLIHEEIYYKTVADIENMSYQFKVRDTELNPILKNTLFEMMSKDAEKRIQLIEAKKRMSLQKFITSETKVVLTESRIQEQSREP